MNAKTRIYVGSMVVVAAAWSLGLYLSSGPAAASMITDAVFLSGLAVAAELLAFLLPYSASGTIGFIPYFAAAIVAPGWPSVVAVVAVKLATELWNRRAPIKAALNIAAHTLMQLVAISIFLSLGGVSLRSLAADGLVQITRQIGFQLLVACAAAALTNNVIVAGAIALSNGRQVRGVLRTNHRPTMLGFNVVAWPLIFVFAWVYVAFGALAAAALWVPILGLRQVHRTNLELERNNAELLELMVKSLEARDPYTSGHSRRVQHYSIVIARALGLGERAIEQIGQAALLHDVGKIHEKYALVLSKMDKLTPEEWTLIQEHPVDGANLVGTMSRLKDIVPAIRHHHENWDGTGYPEGLAGELIPLAARIIRFADTIDAMTTERPYRAPLSEAQVRAEVVRCRGTQFDPMIADKLLSSPLWSTLFAPATVHAGMPSLTVVSTGRRQREVVARTS